MSKNRKSSVKDFGNQFTKHHKLGGFWSSRKMIIDTVKPFNLKRIKNKIICEVGVGSGRILSNLETFNPKQIFAIEPSKAIKVAKKNIRNKKKIKFYNIPGQNMKFKNKFDYVFSLGVIHHIPEYNLVLKKIHRSLKKDGKFIIWVYGYENNEVYVFIFDNLRKIFCYFPDPILNIISKFFTCLTYIYGPLSKIFNLPLKKYFVEIFDKCEFDKRNYIIFDQLNPSFSKYFKKNELEQTLESRGFKILNIRHRHKYSWTAICSK